MRHGLHSLGGQRHGPVWIGMVSCDSLRTGLVECDQCQVRYAVVGSGWICRGEERAERPVWYGRVWLGKPGLAPHRIGMVG